MEHPRMSRYWARRLSSQGCVLESCHSKERASNADITYTNRINYNSLRWIKHSVIFNQHSHTPEKANKHALVIDRKVHSVWENLITAYTYSVYTPLQRQNSRVKKINEWSLLQSVQNIWELICLYLTGGTANDNFLCLLFTMMHKQGITFSRVQNKKPLNLL